MKSYMILKRLIDITFSLLALPFVGIIILIFGILIKLEDNGSVIYKSKRVGKNGKVFNMYKLRSMYINSPDIRLKDGSTYNGKNDFRVTRIGKFIRKTSIDELPQVVNILLGDMSIVGPRPSTPYWLDICKEEEKEIMKVSPGLTGYNQAYFRNSISDEEKYLNDIYYVKNISFFLDLKIFFRTIFTILKLEKVYKSTTSDKEEVITHVESD